MTRLDSELFLELVDDSFSSESPRGYLSSTRSEIALEKKFKLHQLERFDLKPSGVVVLLNAPC